MADKKTKRVASSSSDENMALSRSIYFGSLIMNQVFVRQLPKQRLGKTGIRLSYFDMIIIAVVTILTGVLFFLFAYLVTSIPGIGYSKKFGFRLFFTFIGVVAGIFFGHFASRFSPYQKTSGESLGQWLEVQWGRRRHVIDWLIGRRWEMTRRITWVDGEPIEVDCLVYLGSARMPRTRKPRVREMNAAPDSYKVALAPRTVPTDWVSQVRKRDMAILRISELTRQSREGQGTL